MKTIVLVTLLAVAVNASLFEKHSAKFQTFKVEHSKTYKNQVEEAQRFAIFKEKLQAVEEHNALYEQGLVTYKTGINRFSDMTQEEITSFLNLHIKPSTNATRYVKKEIAVPESIDWRTQGQVTPIKDQSDCGSCWAFSLTGAMEAAYYRKTSNLVSLSEQQLIDCTTDINYGCDGGYMEQTYPYLEQYGIQSETSYPYIVDDGYCQYDSSQIVTKVDDFVGIYQDEAGLLEAVGSVGPVSVSVDASYIIDYKSGVYYDDRCTSTNLNHGVLAVGYGSENGMDYWIIKNSWGINWGEQGYYKLFRGSNHCGVGEDNSYPIIY